MQSLSLPEALDGVCVTEVGGCGGILRILTKYGGSMALEYCYPLRRGQNEGMGACIGICGVLDMVCTHHRMLHAGSLGRVDLLFTLESLGMTSEDAKVRVS